MSTWHNYGALLDPIKQSNNARAKSMNQSMHWQFYQSMNKPMEEIYNCDGLFNGLSSALSLLGANFIVQVKYTLDHLVSFS